MSSGQNKLSVSFKILKHAHSKFEHDFEHWGTYGLFVFRFENSPRSVINLQIIVKFLPQMVH